ncbi:MAG TPA: hypothetical protein VF075_12300 [Pyrinomonadaceae bacterium]
MKLPEQIQLIATVDGNPLPGVLIQVSIVTSFKNNFHLLFRPTDDQGSVVITRGEMIKEALRDQQLFIMDYGDPETDFAGELVISIFGRERLKGAIKVYPDFKDVADYPPDYLNNLHRAQEILGNLGGKEILLSVALSQVNGLMVRTETEY